ncbi:MAG: hypothetical protein ACJ0KI_03840, partial [Dehalococcoidia bacterium]
MTLPEIEQSNQNNSLPRRKDLEISPIQPSRYFEEFVYGVSDWVSVDQTHNNKFMELERDITKHLNDGHKEALVAAFDAMTEPFRYALVNMASSLGVNSVFTDGTIGREAVLKRIFDLRKERVEALHSRQRKAARFEESANRLINENSSLLEKIMTDEFSTDYVQFGEADIKRLIHNLKESVDTVEAVLMAKLRKFPKGSLMSKINDDEETGSVILTERPPKLDERKIFTFLSPAQDRSIETAIKEAVIAAIEIDDEAVVVDFSTTSIKVYDTDYICSLISANGKLRDTMISAIYPIDIDSTVPERVGADDDPALYLSRIPAVWRCSAGHDYSCNIGELIMRATACGGLDYACMKCIPNLGSGIYCPICRSFYSKMDPTSHVRGCPEGEKKYYMKLMGLNYTKALSDLEQDSMWEEIYKILDSELYSDGFGFGTLRLKVMYAIDTDALSIEEMRHKIPDLLNPALQVGFKNEKKVGLKNQKKKQAAEYSFVLGFSFLNPNILTSEFIEQTNEYLVSIEEAIHTVMDSYAIKYTDLSGHARISDQ